jgi:flagellar protein FliJ
MDRMQVLATLMEREEKLRDEALAQCRELERQAAQAQEQVQTLRTYRNEYKDRWTGKFTQSSSIEIMRYYHGFMGRLDQAITAQDGVARQAVVRVERGQEVLRRRELKLATVRRLIERRQEALRLQLDRREQKLNDEAGQRRAWSKRSNAWAA